jgi:hypothetical protein
MVRRALALCILAAAWPATGQETAPVLQPTLAQVARAPSPSSARLSLAEQEQFLVNGRIERVKGVRKGVTGTQRATLSDGVLTHDASIQTIDESKARYETARRLEFNFRDYWGYNVAAYRLGVMLGMDMIPPSVLRTYGTERAAFTWWIDDVMMDEMERQKQKVSPPNMAQWNAQLHILRVFDELIANTDRNQGNMLIDRAWKLWLIDHSRAFRVSRDLQKPRSIRRCERTLLAKMKQLTLQDLQTQLHDYLTEHEIQTVLVRRDKLVAHLEALGPTALYDFALK